MTAAHRHNGGGQVQARGYGTPASGAELAVSLRYQGAAIPGHTYSPRRMVVVTTNNGEVCPRWWPGVAGLAKATGQRWQAVATLVWPGVWSWQA